MQPIIQAVNENPEKVDKMKKEIKTTGNPQKLPNIIKVKATPSGEYMVVITAEDKAIRVFELSAEGQLNHLSKR
jgi:hypothetical protein